MGKKNKIEKQIKQLSQNIDDWHEKANNQGIWIFLATIGCWGVTNNVLQFVALVIVFFMFAYLLSKDTKFKGSFDVQLREIEKKCFNHDLTEKANARLREIRDEKISGVKGMLRVRIGTMGFFFWVCTLSYFLQKNIFH